MEQEEQKLNSLPDNAYRELKPGEVYKPIMPANSTGVRGCYPDRYYRGWMRKSDEKE